MSSSHWKGSVVVAAPAAEVYAYLADFARHPEWDQTTQKVELSEAGDATGVGAKWKAYEALDSLQSDRERKPVFDLAGKVGLTVRQVKELTPDRRVAWHGYPIPRMGTTGDYAFSIEATPDGTAVTFEVSLNTPPVVDAIAKKVFSSMEGKQHEQWTQSLERLKARCEHATEPVAV